MIVHKYINILNFSTEQILNQRVKFINKLAFKNCKHIQYKYTPMNNLTGNLSKHGRFYKNYKLLAKFYIDYISKEIYLLPDNNEFKYLFLLHNSLKDLNRVLFYKITKINPLFNLKLLKKKKILYYLSKKSRVSIVMYWISSLIKIKKNKNSNIFRYYPLKNLISNNNNKNKLYWIKLKIYKHKFLKGE